MHDSFADRSRRDVGPEAIPSQAGSSPAEAGERLACLRSDVAVALQEEEARVFRTGLRHKRFLVQVVSLKLLLIKTIPPASCLAQFRIGYLGSRTGSMKSNYATPSSKAWLYIPLPTEFDEIGACRRGCCPAIDGLVPDSFCSPEADLE